MKDKGKAWRNYHDSLRPEYYSMYKSIRNKVTKQFPKDCDIHRKLQY